MSKLTNPVTGHEVNTDDKSVDFWEAAGYVSAADPKPKKAPAKKAASKKSSSKK